MTYLSGQYVLPTLLSQGYTQIKSLSFLNSLLSAWTGDFIIIQQVVVYAVPTSTRPGWRKMLLF
jgi:hypothetical protein